MVKVRFPFGEVFGFRRGDSWLVNWRDLCEEFLSDPRSLATCKCRDQTALVTLLARETNDDPRIIKDRRLNWPANGLGYHDRHQRRPYDWSTDVLEILRQDHPEAFVVHWMGRPKPWEIAA